jgi:hypothetical protein
MRCSGCGKDIPFGGEVCPYCQRDKSGDQVLTGCMFVAFLIGGGVGYLFNGVIGAIIGGFVLVIAAAIVMVPLAQAKAKKPPEVNVASGEDEKPAPAPPTRPVGETISDRLRRLDDLLAEGVITMQEYEDQRRAIITSL